jgi:hypothetical protein
MSDAVSSVLKKATGPGILRSKLRLETKPLRAVLAALDGARSLRSKLPRSLFGGDVLGIMSSRLRELIQEDEPPQVISSATGARSLTLDDPRDPARSRGPLVDSRAATPESSRRLLVPATAEFQRRGPIGMPPSQTATPSATGSFAAVQSQERTSVDWETASSESRRHPLPLHTLEQSRSGEARLVTRSLLAKKLDQYWEMSQPARLTGTTPDKAAVGGANAPAPGASPSTPLSFGQSRALTRPSWPDLVGRHVAQKVPASGSSSSSKRAVATPGVSEKLEIQNVFNIEVRSEGPGAGSDGDLSERIADILRDQALQHGIDIT